MSQHNLNGYIITCLSHAQPMATPPGLCTTAVTAQNASSEKESCMHGLDCSEHKGVEAVKCSAEAQGQWGV